MTKLKNNSFLFSVLCALAMFVIMHATAEAARAQYTAPPKTQSILADSRNWIPYSNTSLYLLWNPSTAQLPRSAPVRFSRTLPAGTQVGLTNQCASAVVALTGAPATGNRGQFWNRGDQVMKGTAKPGQAIATFAWDPILQRWSYSAMLTGTGHAAVFAGYSPDGLVVWDQNWVPGIMGFHKISGNGNGTTDVTSRFAYYIVK